MRIFPIALIVIGALGVARYLGLIPAGMSHVIGPILLIALGVALLLRRPRYCRGDWHERGGAGKSSDAKSPRTGAP